MSLGDLSVLGVITARGGSVGIKRKNVRPLLGRPLIAYTIDAAKQSTLLSRCIVSTEDDEIASVAESLGAEVPFRRPRELAGPDSSSISAIQHALAWIRREEAREYDAVMVLQPTSPLRTSADIDACISEMARSGADSVMSMMEVPDFSIAKLKRIVDGRILPLSEPEGRTSQHRTELPAVYKRNAAIYLTRRALIESGDVFGEVSRAYVMPRERSIDINDLTDWTLAACLLRSRAEHDT